jgi:beta-D-xylosidase 4
MHYSAFIFVFIIIVVVNGQTGFYPDCKSGPLALFPICNFSLSARQRAADLISCMTIDQKASWLINTVQPIPELGLPPYQWWNEALHDVMFRKPHNGIPEATQFPSPLNLAASFNLDLIHHVAETISTEAHAANNENITGLDFFYTKYKYCSRSTMGSRSRNTLP